MIKAESKLRRQFYDYDDDLDMAYKDVAKYDDKDDENKSGYYLLMKQRIMHLIKKQ